MKKGLLLFLALLQCIALSACTSSENNAEIEWGGLVTANSTNAAVLDLNGTVWTYGYNGIGGLGIGHEPYRTATPQRVMEDVCQLGSGYQHNVALKKDGTVWAWGSGATGGLGKSNKEMTFDEPAKIFSGVTDIAISYNACLVLKKDGSVWGWGYVFGDVENPDASEMISDPHLILKDVSKIYCSNMLFAVIKKDGSLWMWGNNNYGQIGNGKYNSAIAKDSKTPGVMEYMPVKVMDNVNSVCLEQDFILALKNDQTLWAWGNNECGQIGNGESGDGNIETSDAIVTTPYKVMENVNQAKSTYMTSYAIQNDNSLWGWGRNDNAEMGDGVQRSELLNYSQLKTAVKKPVKILDNVKDVFPAAGKCFVSKTDGSFWGWGSNLFSSTGTGLQYSAGDNQTYIVSVPTQISSVMFVKSLAFSKGVKMILVMQEDGEVFSWGEDIYYKAGPVFLREDLPADILEKADNGNGMEILKEYQKKVVAENTFASPVPIQFG